MLQVRIGIVVAASAAPCLAGAISSASAANLGGAPVTAGSDQIVVP